MNTYKTPSIVAVFQLLALLSAASGAGFILYGMKNAATGLLWPGIGLLSGGIANWAVSAVLDYLAKAAHFAEQSALSLRILASKGTGRTC
jgi:hypothetical protein